MADSSEPAFLFLYRKEAVAPVDYLSTFATAPFCKIIITLQISNPHNWALATIPYPQSSPAGPQVL